MGATRAGRAMNAPGRLGRLSGRCCALQPLLILPETGRAPLHLRSAAFLLAPRSQLAKHCRGPRDIGFLMQRQISSQCPENRRKRELRMCLV